MMRVNPEKRGVIAVGQEKFAPGDTVPPAALAKVDKTALLNDGWLIEDEKKRGPGRPKKTESAPNPFDVAGDESEADDE